MSAVVVNYNARDHLVACVRSLRSEGVEEVVVADNSSVDGSGAALQSSDPQARFLPTGGNLGYGTAANMAAEVTTGEALLVCNSDVLVEPGALKSLTAALDADHRLAFVGPRIENSDGTLYPSPRTFPDLGVALGHAALGLVVPANRFTRRYRMLDWDHAGPAEVEWVSGACFLARRDAWDLLGGFDESYFMYAEDVDLCWRARHAGWKVGFEPEARVVHAQGVSTDLAPYRMIVEHHRSLLRFYRKSTVGPAALLAPLVALGLAARAGVACAHRALTAARAR